MLSQIYKALPDISGKSKYSKELEELLEASELGIKPKQVVSASYWAMLLGLLIGAFIFAVNPSPLSFVAIFLLSFSFGQIATDYPKKMAKKIIFSAIDNSSYLVALISSSLKQNPGLENAAEIASEHGHGKISEEIKKALWKCLSGDKEIKGELMGIAEKWGKFSPEFKSSLYTLITASEEKSPEKREMLLQQSTDMLLGRTIENYKMFVENLRTPTLIFFSLGIVLPMIVLTMVPIMSIFSNASTITVISSITALLFLLYIYTERTARARPMGISGPDLKSKNDVNVLYVLGIVFFISMPGILSTLSIFGIYLPISKEFGVLSLLTGISSGLWYYLSKRYENYDKKWKKMDSQEEESINLLQKMSIMLFEKRSAEAVIKDISNSHKGVMKLVFQKAWKAISKMNISVENVFMEGKSDSMDSVLSKRVKAMFSLFSKSYQMGTRAAGDACFFISRQFGALKTAEKRISSIIGGYLNTMVYSVMLIAPFTAGISLGMFQEINQRLSLLPKEMLFEFHSINIDMISLFMGLYLIGLVLLTNNYSSKISNKCSWSLAGKNVMICTGVFIATKFLVSAFI